MYLPKSHVNLTRLPIAQGKDLTNCLRMIHERWRRFYPALAYYPLKLVSEPTQDDVIDTINPIVSNRDDSTAYDDLWGEDIPKDHNYEETGYINPHDSLNAPLADATDTRVYGAGVRVHGQVNHQPSMKELGKYGIDAKKDLEITFPVTILDKARITCKNGDMVWWDNTQYELTSVHQTGYWNNTNIPLYVKCFAQRKYYGS